MGLALCLRRVDATDLQRLLKSPGDVYRFLLGEDPPEPKAGPPKFRWIPFNEIPPEPPERQKAWREGLEIDLDKVWHVIHFLLTGSAGKVNAPEGSLLADGRPIGDCEVGASRAWALLPEETARFAGAIAP